MDDGLSVKCGNLLSNILIFNDR